MVTTPGPVVLSRIHIFKNVKEYFNGIEPFFKIMGTIALGIGLTFLFVMYVVEQNGVANCQKHYGNDYSYDTNASGDNAANKCVNKKTHERKPVVVEK